MFYHSILKQYKSKHLHCCNFDNIRSLITIMSPHHFIQLGSISWRKTLCHAMASRNLFMKEWFLPSLNAEDWGHCWNSLAPPALQSSVFRGSEALNIPSGWRHLRKPPCGQTFNISGRHAWMLVFFSPLNKLAVTKLLRSAFAYHRAAQSFGS